MKKILITGSNGLLGQKLVHALTKRKDVHIIATSLGVNRMIEKEGYTYESLDITNKAEVETVFEK
jgi:dTDP-4-dehydrorhamnose reductase